MQRLAALLAAVALLAAACGGSADDEAAPATTAAAADADASDGGSTSVLDISAPGADGSTIDLSTFAGQDLLLWFWAPW